MIEGAGKRKLLFDFSEQDLSLKNRHQKCDSTEIYLNDINQANEYSF